MENSPSTASQCRELARRCFERAVAEDNVVVRETHLRQGEAWMLRWRNWAPENSSKGASGTA